jgi:hypothetical protein
MEMEPHQPWTTEEKDALLAGVRKFLLTGPKSIPWGWVWARVRGALPGRTKYSIQAYWHSRAKHAGGGGGGGGSGGFKSPWTHQETAVLASAVAAAEGMPGLHTICWDYVARASPLLASRSITAIGAYWRIALNKTPAAQAMLADLLPPPHQQQQQQQQQPVQTPFHMLHCLRSAGSIDEQTLRACWRAAAEAQGRA